MNAVNLQYQTKPKKRVALFLKKNADPLFLIPDNPFTWPYLIYCTCFSEQTTKTNSQEFFFQNKCFSNTGTPNFSLLCKFYHFVFAENVHFFFRIGQCMKLLLSKWRPHFPPTDLTAVPFLCNTTDTSDIKLLYSLVGMGCKAKQLGKCTWKWAVFL